jgi:hypothetical protein
MMYVNWSCFSISRSADRSETLLKLMLTGSSGPKPALSNAGKSNWIGI